jgi:hypothetical protein
MKLAGPGQGVNWWDYRNATPSFDLTAVEKPDFSPFLVHMTGKSAISKILKGESHPKGEVKDGKGFLLAAVPSHGMYTGNFEVEVVCFTESPLFALDFFRYRSKARWEADQQYGIGFSKSKLVKHADVRPVLYTDEKLTASLLALCHQLDSKGCSILDANGAENIHFKESILRLRPLLFSLLETKSLQGFMWEREWRFVSPPGLFFSYQAIEVICCPKDEEEGIRGIVGDAAENIQFVQSWLEYDEVTDFLKKRELAKREEKYDSIEAINSIPKLEALRSENAKAFHALEGYNDIFKETASQLEANGVSGILEELTIYRTRIEKQIESTRAAIKAKEQEAKKNPQKP